MDYKEDAENAKGNGLAVLGHRSPCDEEVAENQSCSGRLVLIDDMSSDTMLENLGCSKMKPAQSTRHHIPNFFTD